MKTRHFLVLIIIFVLAAVWISGCLQTPQSTAALQGTAAQQTIAAISLQYTTTPEDTPGGETATTAPTSTPRPTPTVKPTPQVCTETRGSIRLGEIVIPETTRTLAFRVYTPPCYRESEDYDYPVLYLLHGQSFTDDQWDRLGADEAADRLIASGEAPPFIIVMPFEYYYLQDPRESVYGEQLVNNLIPWVDEEYDTCTERECRAIGGISRGAGWAVHLGFIEWELFGSVGAHSLALFQGDYLALPYWLKEITDDAYPRVYMDAGSIDYLLESTQRFEEQLTRYHVAHAWVVNIGAHNEEYWAAHVEDYLYWYTFAWKNLLAAGESDAITATPGTEE
jgi:enterochelin esterase-like enzyme